MGNPFGNLYTAKKPFSHTPEYYRLLLVIVGTIYLLWWEAVEVLLPGSFNPFLSRVAVVALAWTLCLLTYVSPWFLRRASLCLSVAGWTLTAHYFYLLVYNQGDPVWIAGTYITLMAICAGMQSERSLLAYVGWVIVLSVAAIWWQPSLGRTIFFPGTLTVLLMSVLSLQSRLRWMNQSLETTSWFEDIFDAVFDGIVVHDNGVILQANEAFGEIFGYRQHELIGMHVSDFVMPDSQEYTMEKISAQSEVPYQTSGVRRDGSFVPLEVRGKKHVVHGRTLRLAALTDITDRVKSESDRVRYEASQKSILMRDEFLSIASHELKTPLTNIKLQTQLVSRRVSKGDLEVYRPDQVRHFVDLIDRQANRLTRLVDEMLDVSRISTGKLRLDFEMFDLGESVTAILAGFAASIQQSGSTFEIELARGCVVHADRFRIEQAVSNIVSNAIKYGAGRPVIVKLERGMEDARLSVADKGIGIPAESQSRVFERFERAISARNISGLGLGLYISRDIVEAHGGRIELTSEQGKGSCFTVYLPLATKGNA